MMVITIILTILLTITWFSTDNAMECTQGISDVVIDYGVIVNDAQENIMN